MATTATNGGAVQRTSGQATLESRVFDPFTEFTKDRYSISSLLDWALRPARPYHATSGPAFFDVDLYQRDGTYVAECELPGFDKNDINIEVADNRVIISAKKEEKKMQTDAKYVYRERRQGSFERMFAFAEPVDASRIEASYEKGVLRVEIPMPKATESKNVAIKG